MAPPGANTLSAAQVERTKEITNQRGSTFSFPAGGGTTSSAPYTFVQTFLDSNQFTIEVRKENTGTHVDAKKPGHPPIPEPPSAELDSLINSVVDLVEREILLKWNA